MVDTPHSQYQVTIVKYGTRSTRKSDVYLNFPLYHEDDEPIGMDYFFWILQGQDRTVVVDTGFSRRGGELRSRTSLADVSELFSAFGVDPLSGPDVVVTHAHYDHIGNLSLFANSRVIMARAEFDFWSSRHAGRTMFHHSVEDDELDYLRRVNDDGRLVLFDDGFDVAPGISVMRVGGHTPGQSVVRVDTSEGVVLLASDAIHYYEEYERDMLFMSVADLVAMYEGFDRIRELVSGGDVAHLVSGHDPDTLSRFTRAIGEYSHLAATIGTLDGASRGMAS
jgi:glyoxylase-like metal-dependent hydrolase (beta-lactamase superfamily II)